MPYTENVVHGTPDGYRAGCKTESMCQAVDPEAPWTCVRGYERSRGEYQFALRLKQGLTPTQIHELEQQEEAAYAEAAGKRPKAEKPAKAKQKRAALANHPERLAAYGTAAPAAAARIASIPSPDTHAAALAAPITKEHPMPESVTLPEGVEWADPPERALARRKRGANTTHAAAIEAMKARPRKWLRVGLGGKDAVQRWRHGKIAGTTKGEFEAVIDLATPTDTRGAVFVRYVGAKS